MNPGRPFNSALVIEKDGRLAGVYRKTHLYGDERNAFTAGDAYPVFALRLRADRPPLPVGVAICADIEYPEAIWLLAVGGARLIAVPSADMEPYRAQQAANLASRAIENNAYLALANTVDRRRPRHSSAEAGSLVLLEAWSRPDTAGRDSPSPRSPTPR